jgi:glycosyltransferase involved in cell wall biosynthesis
MLKGDLKWGALHAAEVFVLPSHQENFGIAVAEALSCGLPVLISNRVNIWQEVQATEAGLVASDDLAGTQELCWRWLRLPETARQTMRANARRCFHAHFEIEQVAQRLMRWLEGDQPHFVEVLKRESVAA